MARRETPRFHGFLAIDKPAGLTSHDVVARMRRLTGQRAVGHAGTLDPAATGVLPLALGDATKVINVIADSSKTYRAEITFGIETDTFDGDGQVTAQYSLERLELIDLAGLLKSFTGETRQQVPRYSAVQRGGRRLYDMARAGEDFDPPTREVVINDIQLINFRPPVLTICVDCEAGTYMRSLAADLGRAVGTGAYLSDLVRVRAGTFTISDAWTIGDLARIQLDEQWPSIAHHPDSAILQSAAIILDQADCSRWATGQPISLGARKLEGIVRAYSTEGDWLGLGTAGSTTHLTTAKPKRVIEAGFDLASGSTRTREDRTSVKVRLA